jgi:death on curing protein
MVEISVEEILTLHNSVIERFKITPGVIHQGNLESIAQRPELRISGKYVYNDVFLRAASLLEGIIRLHPFADGNKRTALLATVYYLRLEGYGTAIPLSAVRYTVKVAKNDKNDEQNTQKLIKDC